MIAVVDYGLGNVQAFLNVYKRLNVSAMAVSRPEHFSDAAKIILPGVGAFDHAMDRLNQSGLRDALSEYVLDKRVPVLGVCVGMQILARSSDEGGLAGLGWVDGDVKGFSSLPMSERLHLPHMGWNDVRPAAGNPLFRHLDSDARFYFLHSYYFQCDRPEDAIATADYGSEFSCAVGVRNIYGVQFHPEKSHGFGTRLLQNFAEL